MRDVQLGNSCPQITLNNRQSCAYHNLKNGSRVPTSTTMIMTFQHNKPRVNTIDLLVGDEEGNIPINEVARLWSIGVPFFAEWTAGGSCCLVLRRDMNHHDWHPVRGEGGPAKERSILKELRQEKVPHCEYLWVKKGVPLYEGSLISRGIEAQTVYAGSWKFWLQSSSFRGEDERDCTIPIARIDKRTHSHEISGP